MKSGREYRHPRFLDVTFRVRQCGFYSGHYKYKAIWLVRGRDIGIVTKHSISPNKAREFEVIK